VTILLTLLPTLESIVIEMMIN